MSSKKLLTIFGATGNQGGSVVSAVLGSSSLSSKYALRAITRDPSKPNAKSLADKGVDLAKADLNDPDSIAAAIQDSYGVFAVTNYWETQDKQIEYQQGVNIVDACKAQGVKHLVWSALPHATKISDGTLTKIEHFDSKAEVAEYAEKTKGDLMVSYFMPGYFMTNLTTSVKPAEDGSGNYAISLPWDPEKTWVGMIDIRADTGKFVVGLWEAGKEADGKYVQGVSEWVHPNQIVAEISKATGKTVEWNQTEMSVEIADTLPKIPAELMENMLLIRDYSYFGNGAERKQDESDKFFLKGEKKEAWKQFAKSADWKL